MIASSFADIFYNNSFKNGILLVRLSEEEIDDLFKRAAAHENYKLTVDLEAKKITDGYGLDQPFELDEFRRTRLLQGLDDIALTLRNEADITAYEKAHGVC